MKKNKTVAYMLATALLLGGTFVGTNALFSDTETSNNNLILKTGKVDITVSENDWLKNVQDQNGDGQITAIDRPYNQGCEQNSNGEFNNIQPGDTFTRYINILNQESSYSVDLSIIEELNSNNPELMKHISVDSSDLNGRTIIPANANTGGYITVKIADTQEAWQAFNGAKPLNIDAVYTITATQSK